MQDLAWRYHGTMSTVANTMINYIRDFFSCRDCSENFNSHVASIGYLPRNPDQSLLWLWTIHNTANVLLSGDPTEVTFIRLMSSLHYSSGSSSSQDSLAQPGQLPSLPEKWIWKQVVTNASVSIKTLEYFTPIFATTLVRVNGELWNQAEVLDYLRKVYSADNIITYQREDVTKADNIKIILDKLKTNTNTPNDGAFVEAEEELLEICEA